MTTPLVETSSFNDILSPSVEDQINSLVSSYIENNNNNSLEIVEVIDNAYKYAEHKKIKDVLLPEIKNDVSDFIQNKVKQKINLHNQEESQTVVDKKLIANLDQNPHRIVIGHLNINSIRNKFESLVRFVDNNLDILMVSETKIDDTFPESQFLIKGFSKPFRLDRTAKGGVILLCIREGTL